VSEWASGERRCASWQPIRHKHSQPVRVVVELVVVELLIVELVEVELVVVELVVVELLIVELVVVELVIVVVVELVGVVSMMMMTMMKEQQSNSSSPCLSPRSRCTTSSRSPPADLACRTAPARSGRSWTSGGLRAAASRSERGLNQRRWNTGGDNMSVWEHLDKGTLYFSSVQTQQENTHVERLNVL